jgi:hypothetical protein
MAAQHTTHTDAARSRRTRRRGGEVDAKDGGGSTRNAHQSRTRRRRLAAGAVRARSNPRKARTPGTDLVLYQPPVESPLKERVVERLTQLYYSVSLALHRFQHRPPKQRTAKIVVVVPAHNEEASIARTLQALLQQTRRPDRVIVVADNCSDKTVEVARRFGSRVTVIETVGNRDRKVGALTMAW